MAVKRGRLVDKITRYEWGCVCERCDYRWVSIGPEPPARCARCKQSGFDKPRRWSNTPKKTKR